MNKELLKLAAKAAGIKVVFVHDENLCMQVNEGTSLWHPHNDNKAAFELAVNLDMDIYQMVSGVKVAECIGLDGEDSFMVYEEYKKHGNDKMSATRLAILRCAAEIGRQKSNTKTIGSNVSA